MLIPCDQIASMRPRPLGRGNVGRRGTVMSEQDTASMRPRPLGRGNGELVWLEPVLFRMLQ